MARNQYDTCCCLALTVLAVAFGAFFGTTEYPEIYRHNDYVSAVATVLYAYAQPRFCPVITDCQGCFSYAPYAPSCYAVANAAAAGDPLACGAVDAGIIAADTAALAGRARPSSSALPSLLPFPSPAPTPNMTIPVNGTDGARRAQWSDATIQPAVLVTSLLQEDLINSVLPYNEETALSPVTGSSTTSHG